DEWRDQGKFHVAPRTLRELEMWLLRQEQHWRGRRTEEELKHKLQPEIERCRKRAGDAWKQWNTPLDGTPKPSLARAGQEAKTAELTAALKTALEKLGAKDAKEGKPEKPAPEPSEAEWDKKIKDAVKELGEKLKERAASPELAVAVLDLA